MESIITKLLLNKSIKQLNRLIFLTYFGYREGLVLTETLKFNDDGIVAVVGIFVVVVFIVVCDSSSVLLLSISAFRD